jgi:tRNA U34 2-thiouridine synthase MnmA/TrmU
MKAIALLSGGLDSTLAIEVTLDSAIVSLEIEALHFTTVFCRCDGAQGECGSSAKKIADKFNLSVKNINNTSSLLEAVKKPKYGYGSNINPCIDCRISMFRSAKERMNQAGASFLITGEVLGQRPMSQHLSALSLIEKETNLKGLILRPLSAKLLEPTIPEKNRWIDREKLLAISGRSRKEQISLANLFEIKDYPCPAGGCLLTDPGFAMRMKDLLTYQPDFELNDVLLLNIGRHFRLNKDLKLIIGRNEKENHTLTNLAKADDILFEIADYTGPVSLLRGLFIEDDLRLAGRITARYADIDSSAVRLKILSDDTIAPDNITALNNTEIDRYRINV